MPSPPQHSLVPVTLKEAALDSPTFRGTVSHYAEQVDYVDRWLDGYVKATMKLCHEVLGLEEYVSGFMGRLAPNNLSESVMDQDYTVLTIKRYSEGSKGFWGNVITGARKIERTVVNPLVTFQQSELRNFKDIRRLLSETQSRYDNLLARYAAQSKSKEPSSLREDAFQLFEARKAYTKASFDFCLVASTFRTALDRTLNKVLSDQWREQMALRKENIAASEKCNLDIERIRAWSDSMESSEAVFRTQIENARNDLEERSRRQWQPARELEEYASSTVPYLSSRPNVSGPAMDGEQGSSEKQGWLFMRTLTGKPTRTVWIRRWFFVKAGIFGWLVQGVRNGVVEESEKIGVLLCNSKPAFQEERRFCFEVKTKDTSILLQAETQADLTSWLAVFEQAKRAAVESATSTQAFSIIPPSGPAPPSEPAFVTREGNPASSNIITPGGPGHSLNPLHIPRHRHVRSNDEDSSVIDRALAVPTSGISRATSMDISRNDNLTPTPSGTREKISQKLEAHRKTASNSSQMNPASSGLGISALIAASHNAVMPLQPEVPKQPSPEPVLLRSSTLAPTTLVATPAPVNLLKAARVTSGSGVGGPASDIRVKTHKKTLSLDVEVPQGADGDTGEVNYPPGYPPELRAQDEHFRMLFPDRKKEFVLLVFRATWSPSDTQELPGRCYVTAENIYFYAHYLGLVFTSTTPFTSISEVRAAPEKDCDYIFINLRTDEEQSANPEEQPRVTLKVFLEPLRLLQRRLHFLATNQNSTVHDDPPRLPVKELLPKLVAMEKEVEKNGTDTESWEDVDGFLDAHDDIGKRRGGEELKLHIDDNLLPRGRADPKGADDKAKAVKLPSEPVIYEPGEYWKKTLEQEFELPPKALFHVMFGDKSTVFQTVYRQRRAMEIHQTPWIPSENGRLKREFTYDINNVNFLGRSRKAHVVDHQTIEKQDEHLCYVITDLKTPWHLPFPDNFMLASRIAITHFSNGKCKLAVWTAVEWSKIPPFSKGIVQKQALNDLTLDALDLRDVVADQIRKLGSHSRTKKAVYMFGHVGQEMPGFAVASGTGENAGALLASQVERSPRIPMKQRSLSRMMLEIGLSFTESAVTSVIMWSFAALRKGWEIVSAQRLLLCLLTFSIITNTMLSSRATVSYWNERRAFKFVENVGVTPNGIMARAVYLRDLDDMVNSGTHLAQDPSRECFGKFRELAMSSDIAAEDDIVERISASASTKSTATRLRAGRQRLGTYRHDLLVAIRVVNSLERDMLRAEWDSWLVGETSRCRQARHFFDAVRNGTESNRLRGRFSDAEAEKVAGWLSEYCSSCEAERFDAGDQGLAFY